MQVLCVSKEAEMQKRIELFKLFLGKVKREGNTFLDRVITCDETWLWLYEPASNNRALSGQRKTLQQRRHDPTKVGEKTCLSCFVTKKE
jgi:hypothetical protein